MKNLIIFLFLIIFSLLAAQEAPGDGGFQEVMADEEIKFSATLEKKEPSLWSFDVLLYDEVRGEIFSDGTASLTNQVGLVLAGSYLAPEKSFGFSYAVEAGYNKGFLGEEISSFFGEVEAETFYALSSNYQLFAGAVIGIKDSNNPLVSLSTKAFIGLKYKEERPEEGEGAGFFMETKLEGINLQYAADELTMPFASLKLSNQIKKVFSEDSFFKKVIVQQAATTGLDGSFQQISVSAETEASISVGKAEKGLFGETGEDGEQRQAATPAQKWLAGELVINILSSFDYQPLTAAAVMQTNVTAKYVTEMWHLAVTFERTHNLQSKESAQALELELGTSFSIAEIAFQVTVFAGAELDGEFAVSRHYLGGRINTQITENVYLDVEATAYFDKDMEFEKASATIGIGIGKGDLK